MGLFYRAANYIKNDVKKIVGTDQVIKNAKWIGKMGRRVELPTAASVAAITHIAILPANYEAFENAMRSKSVSECDLKRIHGNYVLKAYIGFIGFLASVVVIVINGGLSYLPGIGAICISIAVWFGGSYAAYCINHRHLDGFLRFAGAYTEYLPNPFFVTALPPKPAGGFPQN